MIPVLGVGVVEAELDALSIAGGLELGDHVAFEGGGIDDVVIADLGVKESETVVVLAGDDDIFHAGIFGDVDPLGGAELARVAGFGQLGVILDGDLFGVHVPLALADLGVEAPVDEEAEFILIEPVGPARSGTRGSRWCGWCGCVE